MRTSVRAQLLEQGRDVEREVWDDVAKVEQAFVLERDRLGGGAERGDERAVRIDEERDAHAVGEVPEAADDELPEALVGRHDLDRDVGRLEHVVNEPA